MPPSLRLGGDGDRAPRPASETGLPGRRRRARPRAREARDALAPCLDRPAGRRGDPPCGETHKSPNHAGFPGITGGKYPRGDLTRVMSGDVSVHASAETRRYLATVPGRFEFVSAPRHGSWLDTGRGPPLEDGPPDAARRPGLQQGRAQGEDPAPPRGRAPSRSPAGGGGTCRTQARQPRSSSWTLSSRMRWARQVSFWTLR